MAATTWLTNVCNPDIADEESNSLKKSLLVLSTPFMMGSNIFSFF